jgi:hypothetical protein
MGRSANITYRLPCAVIVISGTVRRTLDKDRDPGQTVDGVRAELVSKTVQVRHQADDGSDRTVTVKGGWFFQYKSSFSLQEEGRFRKASAESSGPVAELISAGATLAGVALAAAKVTFEAAEGRTVEKRRRDNYKMAYEEVAGERAALAGERGRLRAKLRALEAALIDDPGNSATLRPQLQALRETERLLDERIAVLDAHYAAWLATRVTSVDDQFELAVRLADLPVTVEDADAKFGGKALSDTSPGAVPDDPGELWRRYGLAMLATWARNRADTDQVAAAEPDDLVAREAEPVTISVVEHVSGQPVVTSRSRHLVADTRSPLRVYRLERSWFGRRSLALSFSENGYLSGVEAEGAAALGAAAKALAGTPTAAASGVESVTTLQSGLATARQAGLAAQLTRVKSQVELRQQEVLAAGLDVTADDAARLARLNQLKEIFEAQTAIRDVDPSLVIAAKAAAAGDLGWYSAAEQPRSSAE